MNKAGIEVFDGFGIKLPEYEVVTPQGNKKFTVRSMSIADEDNLKGSLIVPSSFPEHLAQVLWNCIVKKPENIKTFNDFISNTTLKDRDALIYGLYATTYKNMHTYEVVCDKCGHTNTVNIDIDKALQGTFWDPNEVIDTEKGTKKGDIISYRRTVDLKEFNGVHCVLKAPTIKDEIYYSEHDDSSDDNKKKNLSMIDRFYQDPTRDRPKGDEYKERDNIRLAWNSIPPSDAKMINKIYADEFLKYNVKAVATVICQNTKCKDKQEVELDFTSQFFRALYQ